MAILWNGSLIPWIDENGDPYAGAQAYFFEYGTTTPLTTYTTADLSIPNDHPVLANASGMFPPVFLADQTTYRLRIKDADDVTLWDVDSISAPTTTIPDPPTSDTDNQYLYQTGDIKMAWRTGSPTGYVRLNGRTIGAASSGATERANADCEDLFVHLWENDSNLAVSGTRGATSAGDWAAAKTIALPDWRGVVPVGTLGMGNTALTTIPTDLIDGGDGDALGATAGEATHTLVADELPAITPTFTGEALAAHGHATKVGKGSSDTNATGGLALQAQVISDYEANTGAVDTAAGKQIAGASAGTPAGTISSFGSDDAHNNMQPSIFVPFFIKL